MTDALTKALSDPTDVQRTDIGQPTNPAKVPTLLIRPKVADILEGGSNIIEAQMRHYLEAVKLGALDPQEVAAFAKLMDATAKLSREERELRKEAKPRSEAELKAFLKQMVLEGVIDVEGE